MIGKKLKRISLQLNLNSVLRKPKKGIISQALLSMKSVLEGAAGNLVASGLAEKIPVLLAMLNNA